MNKQLIAGAIALSLAFGSTGAFAQSADLTTWSSAGDVQGVTFSTATLTTAATLPDPLGGPSTEIPASGVDALMYYALEPALGLSAGALSDPTTYEGSGLASVFNVSAATSISFNWVLSTSVVDSGFLDQAFVVIDGIYQPFAVVSATPTSGTFSTSFLTNGAHSLAFGVMDVNDVTGVSTLQVSNFAVTAVPEPGSVAMMLAGLGALGAMARRRRV